MRALLIAIVVVLLALALLAFLGLLELATNVAVLLLVIAGAVVVFAYAVDRR